MVDLILLTFGGGLLVVKSYLYLYFAHTLFWHHLLSNETPSLDTSYYQQPICINVVSLV